MHAMTKAVVTAAMMAGLACCDPAAPDCARAIDSGTQHVSVDLPLDRDTQRIGERFVPYDPRYTGSDVDYLIAACHREAWSADYRRCIAGMTGPADLAECNDRAGDASSAAWVAAPHAMAWLAAVTTVEQDALARIHADAVAAREAASDAARQLADLDTAVDAADTAPARVAELQRARADLAARAARAEATARAAEALDNDCEFSPLAKPACVDRMKQPSR